MSDLELLPKAKEALQRYEDMGRTSYLFPAERDLLPILRSFIRRVEADLPTTEPDDDDVIAAMQRELGGEGGA